MQWYNHSLEGHQYQDLTSEDGITILYYARRMELLSVREPIPKHMSRYLAKASLGFSVDAILVLQYIIYRATSIIKGRLLHLYYGDTHTYT